MKAIISLMSIDKFEMEAILKEIKKVINSGVCEAEFFFQEIK